MAMTMRTANLVAHPPNRVFPVALPTAAPSPITNPNQGHGVTGSDDCILTVAVDSTVSGNTTIYCYFWSATAKQWLKAGAAASVYSKLFEPGSADVFVLPEGVAYYLYGSQAIAQGLLYVDGQQFNSISG